MISRRDAKSGKFTKLEKKLMGGAPGDGGSNPASEGGKGFTINTRGLAARKRQEKREEEKSAAQKKRQDEAAARSKEQRKATLNKRRKRYVAGSDENLSVQAGDYYGPKGLPLTEEQTKQLSDLKASLDAKAVRDTLRFRFSSNGDVYVMRPDTGIYSKLKANPKARTLVVDQFYAEAQSPSVKKRKSQIATQA